MKNVFRWLKAILLSAALAGLVQGQQATNESPPAQAQSSPSADAAIGNDESAIDPARLAERDRLVEQAIQLHAEGKIDQAIALCEQILTLERTLFGVEQPELVETLHGIAAFQEEGENFVGAKAALQEVLQIKTKQLGKDHFDVTDARWAVHDVEKRSTLTPEQRRRLFGAYDANEKILALYQKGQFADSFAGAMNSLEAYKELLGEMHPATATSLNNLAQLYDAQGDYRRALPLCERALAIRKQTLGEMHPETAGSLITLASLHKAQGDYARALPLSQHAVAIYKKILGENHPDTATSLNNLGSLFEAQGDFARALPLYQQSLAIARHELGENHLDTAASLNNLALLFKSQGDYDRAQPLYEQALAIRRQALGQNHPDTATSLNNLAGLYFAQADYERALPLLEQALEIHKQVSGESHPDTAASLNNLAFLYFWQGDYARALPLFEQVLAIQTQAFGEEHPIVANTFSNLGGLYYAQGDYVRALPLFQRASEIVVAHLDATASIQSERQQLAQSNQNKGYVDILVSCALMAGRFENAAYQQVMANKGAVFRRQRQLQLMRSANDPDEVRLWHDYQNVATRLATTGLRNPPPDAVAAWRRLLANLTEQKERMEAELSQRNSEFRELKIESKLAPDQLRGALPFDIAIVDLLEVSRQLIKERHERIPQHGEERRVAAFILRADSPVVAIDLGLADPIDAAVDAWREQLEKRSGYGEFTGQLLRRLIWEPLTPHLEGATTVLVSPDGALASIPWGALPGKKPGTYLLAERAIAIVPVPQLIPDMLHEAKDVAAPSLFVVGNVDYGGAPGQAVLVAQSRSAPRGGTDRDGLRGMWPALAATRPEVAGIEGSFHKAFPPADVTKLQAAAATEEAFRQQAGQHRFLHLATHGFFAPPEIRSALAPDKTLEGTLGQSDLFGESGVVGFHPGLLSGIVLAGANLHPEPERDDGILTALEVGSLDLRNVDLVTLSACETGLGQVAGGEGILGLQRAFQIAGARTTVASLWKVNDDATRALMTEFYNNLWEKKLPRIEALRQAQIAMLNGYDPDSGALRGPGGVVDVEPEELVESNDGAAKPAGSRTPPAYWAAFVLSGDWR